MERRFSYREARSAAIAREWRQRNRLPRAPHPTFARYATITIVAARNAPMGTADRSKSVQALTPASELRSRVGAVSWVVTSASALHGAPPTHSHPSAFTSRPTQPVVCVLHELVLTGVLNECATAIPDQKLVCSVSGDTLEAVLRLASNNESYLLSIEVKSSYAGPGMYPLAAWRYGLGTTDVPKVAVVQSATGAFWRVGCRGTNRYQR